MKNVYICQFCDVLHHSFSGATSVITTLDQPYSKKHVAGDETMNNWMPGKGSAQLARLSSEAWLLLF